MKQKLLNSIRLRAMMLVAVMCAAFAGQAWATDPTWSHVFASPEAISSNSITVDGATWTVSTTAGAGSPTISAGNSNSKYGLKFGSNKSTYYGSVTFSTDYFKNYNVKSVSVNILNNGSKPGTLTAVQGDTSIGSTSQTFGQTWTTLTVNTNAGSGGTLSFTYSVEQAFYINSITVTYEDNGGGGGSTVDAPSFSSVAGAVTAGTTITLTQATADEIRYTIDGTDPTKTTGTVYSEPIEITTATTIKAIAVEGDDVSDVATASYTISVATPVFNLDSNGFYLPGTGVTLTSTGNTIYYNMTTDGNDPEAPTSISTEYADPISLSSGTLKIKAIAYDSYGNTSSVVSRTINGVNPTTLPFNWAGGGKDALTALTGVVGFGLGSDYGDTHNPYMVKFDNDNDYIEVFTDAQPMKVSVGVKMIGGANTSTIKVQESTNGVAFTDVENLTIEGSANDIVNLETTADFAATTRVIKLLFVKGSNVGVGPIRITKYTVGPDIDVTDSDVELAGDATSGEIEYSIINPDGVSSLSAESEDDWISEITVTASKVTFTTTANDGEEREGTITLSYTGAENKVVTVTQAEKVVTLTYSPAASITSGKHYIITNGTSGTVKAMGAQRDSNRGSVDVTVDAGNNISFLSNAGVAELIIYGPDAGGYYTIYDGTGYLYAASSSANQLKTQTNITDNGRWSITIDGNATIKAQGNYTRNLMRNNGDLFSCYSSGQNAVYLYEKAGEATPTESVTVGAAGYTTYTTVNPVSFPTGVTAYIATQVNAETIHLEEVLDAPARTPLVIQAEAGSYTLERGYAGLYIETITATPNILQSSNGSVKGNGSNIFALGVGKVAPYEGVVGFYLVNNGQTVPAGKAYLEVTAPGVKGFTFDFDGVATGVNAIAKGQEATANGQIFNLAGQRVNKAQKGLYILNGRKVLVK